MRYLISMFLCFSAVNAESIPEALELGPLQQALYEQAVSKPVKLPEQPAKPSVASLPRSLAQPPEQPEKPSVVPATSSSRSLEDIIASNQKYLDSLFSISGVPDSVNQLNNPEGVQSILAILTVQRLDDLKEALNADPNQLVIQNGIDRLKKTAPKPPVAVSPAAAPKPPVVVSPAAAPKPNIDALLKDHIQYDLEGVGKVVRFNVAPLGDCGLLSLPINLSRDAATQQIQRALDANRFDADDASYLRAQHHHLATEGQSLQQKHLKLIGVLLGFNVRFLSDIGGMLIEDTDIKINTKVPGLTDALIFDGEGHFEALIPTSNQTELQRAYETEQTSKRITAEFQSRYQ